MTLKPPVTAPKPPKHLSSAAKAWWVHVNDEYLLEMHHKQLLLHACEAMDRCETARAALAIHGETYIDNHGNPRTRPEIAIERDSRLAFARLLRELDLDVPPAQPTRPPSLRSNRRE